MIWLPLLKRFGPALAIFVVFVAAYGGFRNAVSSAYQKGYKAAEASMAKRVAEANAITAEREASARRLSDAASAAWEKQRAELEAQVARIVVGKPRVIRLCPDPASAGQLPAAADPARSADGQPAAAIDAVRAGDDIAGPSVVFAAKCERYRQQLSALQQWVTEQSRPTTAPSE